MWARRGAATMQKTGMTIQEFEQFALLPENAERRLELIDGEIVEMAPGRTSNSGASYVLGHKVFDFCEAHDLPCYVSGGDGDYDILGHIICPDFAYKPTPFSGEYPDPEPPLWAVEIISPNDKANDIRRKREIYQDAGILYWEMYPNAQ
jgi:Uma2 family endonuclease